VGNPWKGATSGWPVPQPRGLAPAATLDLLAALKDAATALTALGIPFDGRLGDLRVTDCSSEWFKCWGNKEYDQDAEGERWVARNADGFLSFADSARLSGPKLGQTRRELRELLGRVGPHAHARPSILLWSKSDHSVSETVRQAIETMSKQAIPEVVQESITYKQPETMIAAFSALVEQMLNPKGRKGASIQLPVMAEDPFFAIRGSR